MRAIRKSTEKARRSLWRPTYIPINKNKPPNMKNNTSTDVTYGGAWFNRVVAKQEDCHSAASTDK